MKFSLKFSVILFITTLFLSSVQAQFKHPPKVSTTNPISAPKGLNLPNGFKNVKKVQHKSVTYKTLPSLTIPSADFKRTQIIKDKETPIFLKAHLPSSRSNVSLRAFEFLDFVKADLEISDPASSFTIIGETIDKLGGKHIKLGQNIQGVPLYGKEIVVHELGDMDMSMTGRFVMNPPNISAIPSIKEQDAIDFAKEDVKGLTTYNPISETVRKQIEMPEHIVELVFYEYNEKIQLAYHVSVFPNIQERWESFVNAETGTIIRAYKNSCSFAPIHNHDNHNHKAHSETPNYKNEIISTSIEVNPEGDETDNATDLNGISRTIHTYSLSNTRYMIDASLSMFKSGQSNMPDQPVGALWTIDGQNTSPTSSNFRAAHVTKGNSWDPKAVSAHYNARKAYEYFKNTHNRNSINGQGGTVRSFINIVDENNKQMDNAFWNGFGIYYGNGIQAFGVMQKSLDVGGHEMSHGVIQNTANLEYLSQSGAMNESFADIFGAMIDRNDWQLGESIVNTNFFPSGALRDLSNPHNGGTPNDHYWQPKNMSEYKTLPETQQGDNGGVHLNSGIVNYAYYLVATSIGKNNAEDIYYHALKNYLVRSSQFIDLRVAVVQSAKQLFGASSTELAAVESAFNSVGIGSGTSGGGGNDHQTDIEQNNGSEHILSVGTAQSFIYLSNTDGTNLQQLSQEETISNPSITDDGQYIVYIAADKTMHLITLNWQTSAVEESVLQNESIWRNVIIAKDGTRIAALTDQRENNISVYDFSVGAWNNFELYNPTYTQGVSTGDVKYADAMEFDITGEYVLYDAFNEMKSEFGSNLDYWDIGFLKVWNNTTSNWNDGGVSKLFSGLPENTSVGNPSFAKNSPYMVTFDFIDQSNNYLLMTSNTQTGKSSDPAIFTNGVINFPNFSTNDRKILFNANDTDGNSILAVVDISTDKLQAVPNSAVGLIGDQQWGHWFATGTRNLVATENMDNIHVLSLFPNPTSNTIQIDMEASEAMSGNVSIFNLQGQEMMTKKIDAQQGKNQFVIDITKLNTGSYLMVFHLDNQVFSRQIIKM